MLYRKTGDHCTRNQYFKFGPSGKLLCEEKRYIYGNSGRMRRIGAGFAKETVFASGRVKTGFVSIGKTTGEKCCGVGNS